MTARPGIPQPVAQSVMLRNVSWDTYERLLSEHQDVCNPRFAFDRGMLQIMVTSFEHETVNRLIARLFETIAEELTVDYVNAGSTTFKKQEAERGFEPDTAFYVRNAELVRGKERIDLSVGPAPDLVIEITHPSIDKLPIFAGLGVAEVWRYEGRALVIMNLD
jgi:Uma2 family endonuclease